jgi:exopolyphosphatase/guanosine-5'-triphosphate,3'-diphosphate pyrophosphatase
MAFITTTIGMREPEIERCGHHPCMERLAVIDMGSNSWRLVVFGHEPGTPWWSLVDEIREAVRIAAGVDETGALREDRVERGLHTAAVFSAFCRATGVDEVEPVATSAIRDASNGEALLVDIARTTGLRARVISGDEEARYDWLAIANSTTLEDGYGLDIGGGSIQALRLEGRRLAASTSLPLGAVRMSERFLPGEKAGRRQMDALRAHVSGELERLGWWGKGGRIVGVGGTIRNLAAAAMKRTDLPEIDVQGFLLTRGALDELIDELGARPASKRGQVKGIKYDRADVILGGALVLATGLDEGGFDAIEVTEAGLREGIFFEKLLGERELFSDVRAESVRNLAHRFDHHDEHSEHVWALSSSIFDGLAAAGLHGYGAEERDLLWAACMLHDIGVAVDYDDHHRHSYYLTLNAGLPGYTPRELVLIGLVARYHRKGTPDASDLGDLADEGDEHRLELLCGVIRLAEQLERSRDRAIADVRVAAYDGTVALEARVDPSGDATVPIWAARRNAGLLSEAIGRELKISG